METRRKLIHIAFGIVVVILLRFELISAVHILILLLGGLVLSYASKKYSVPTIDWCLEKFDRPGVKPPGRGAITFFAGILAVLVLFGNGSIAHASIMILTFGDSFSSMVGRRLKQTRHLVKTKSPVHREKLLEGTLWGIIAGTLGATVFVSILEAILASGIAMTIEGLEVRYKKEVIDDNILIPIAAGITIFLVRLFFH